MTANYKSFRSQLSESERQELKAIARAKGMTLTGLHDHAMREVIKSQKTTGEGRRSFFSE